jgi:DNA topoisomerase-1
MNLLIVESPGKIKKIQSFLGSGWKVMASKGHVRDLPKQGDGLTPPDFVPRYQPTDSGKKVLADLAKAVKEADAVYLATDPDREGEGIAWHLAEALKLASPKRVMFHEITEKAVLEAVANPGTIDRHLVKAQEARRVLDRLVGYGTSAPLINSAGWGASAGRVQSPALRLVVEREQAVRDFKSVTHYGVELTFEALDHAVDGWRAQWNAKNWLQDGQDYFLDRETAEKVSALRRLQVVSQQESESKEAPPAPFTTSSLQQAASNTLKFSPKRTMELAQKLYESGSITYMRTDSPNLSEEAIADIRSLASKNDWPMPPAPRTWKSKAGAQEAHEAIRLTHVEVEEAGANADEKALYTLIRLRTLAGQLEDAVYAVSTVILEGELDGRKVTFEGRGRRMTRPGWRVVLAKDQAEESDGEAEPDNNIPKLREGSQAVAVSGKLLTRKTKPAARFTEASLIRELEKLGIGRPSTYAATLEKLTASGQVTVEKRQLVPTELGERVIRALRGNFGFLDYTYTREMETRLDSIAAGEAEYKNVVAAAHEILGRELSEFSKISVHLCPDCGKVLRHKIKNGDNGYDYWACSGRPDCQASYDNEDGHPGRKRQPIGAAPSEFPCPKCQKPLYRRQGVSQKTGKAYDFYGCADRACNAVYYPKDDGSPDFNRKPGK